jgi:uncharacterized protein (DUF2236 family)
VGLVVLGVSGPAGTASDVVTRAFRRLLSGSPDGRPDWVRALEDPGDQGWFGPSSAAWAVHGSLATLVGGVRALLLQAAHPLALAGVVQHSDYRADPLGRLQRTNRYLTTTTFGSTAQAQQAVRRVCAAHRAVVGHAPDGRPYAAADPDLLAWVHVALTDSMLAAARQYGPRDVDPDGYVADVAVTARALGIPDPPRTASELTTVLESYLPQLSADRSTRDVVRFLMAPPLPLAAQPAYQVLARAAVDQLPGWGLDLLGLPDRPGFIRAVDQAACAALLSGLRRVLGPHSPGQRAALARLPPAVV